MLDALRAALAGGTPFAPRVLASRFRGVRPARLAPMLLDTLVALGQARKAESGRYVA